jgi:hypothetical protein
MKACLKGFLQGIPAFFTERHKDIKVKPETVRKFIALVRQEQKIH